MRFLSLFAGIGGMDLGLERAGMTCVGQCEINPFCLRVLAKHWPNVWRHGDIRTLTGAMVNENCGRIDIIAGGFPCQDVSRTGLRAGIGGERSGLWGEFHRIVCEIRPRYALVENVPGLLDGGLGRVLGDLAEIGYDAEWDCLPASAFGAYHERDRLFVLAYDRGATGAARYVLEASRERGPSLQHKRLHCMALAERGKRSGSRLEHEPRLVRLVHGVPDRTYRLASLGNAVYPAVAEWIGRRIMEAPQ